MVTSVLAGFKEFIKAISISGDQQATSTARKDRIVSLLEKENFTVIDAFPTGSIPKKTGVKCCDLDVMVVLHYTLHIKDKLPSQVLQAVRDALAEYRTNVRKNGQAVTLYYESWPNVDIVPVYRNDNDDRTVNHYGVPDMNSTPESWITSRPRRHASAIDDRAAAFGREFRHIIRMAKWWNQKHSDYLQSYHIEVLALQAISGTFSTYSEGMYNFFSSAYSSLSATSYTANLWYEDSWVDSYLSSSDRQEVTKRLKTARDLAYEAWNAIAGSNSDVEEAVNLWQRIFGDKFPNFG
jgi:hypothetical protein